MQALEIDLSNPVTTRGFPDGEPSVTLIHGVRGVGKSLLARALAARAVRPALLIDEIEAVHPADLGAELDATPDGVDVYMTAQHPHEIARGVMEDVDFTVEVYRPVERRRRGREVVACVRDRREAHGALLQDTPEIARILYTGLKMFWLPAPMVNKLVRMQESDLATLTRLDSNSATHHIRRAIREYVERREGAKNGHH